MKARCWEELGLAEYAVYAVAAFIFRGCDLDIVLLAGRGDEAAHAMSLPSRKLPQFGEAGTLLAADQGQQLRAFAFGLRGTRILGEPLVYPSSSGSGEVGSRLLWLI